MDIELIKSLKEYRNKVLKSIDILAAASYLKSNKFYNEKFNYNNLSDKEIINLKNNYDNTALFWASINNYKDIVELLIKAGADLNLKDNYDNTALIWASIFNHKDIVELLIKAGADLN